MLKINKVKRRNLGGLLFLGFRQRVPPQTCSWPRYIQKHSKRILQRKHRKENVQVITKNKRGWSLIWQMNYVQKNELDLLHVGFFYTQIRMSSLWAWFISWKEKSKDSQPINGLIPGSGSLPSVGWIKPGGFGLLGLSP